MNFTLDEIIIAWSEFTSPRYFYKEGNDEIKEIKGNKLIAEDPASFEQVDINHSKWIEFLVKWKKSRRSK